MEEETQEKKWQREKKEENMKIVCALVNALSGIFDRQCSIDDQCLRSCLFVDKLALTLDIGIAVLSAHIDEDFPLDLISKINKLQETVNGEIKLLMQYCRSPTYDPDHPYGRMVMNKTSFYQSAENNDA